MRASQPPGTEYHLQALYGEAACWNHRRDGRDIAKAVAAYRAVIDQAPHSPLAAWCALDIVRSQHLAPANQTIDYERLVRDYADVYRRYPQSPAGEEAFLYETNLSLPSADSAKARKILEKVQAFLTCASQDALLVPVLYRNCRVPSPYGRTESTDRIYDQGVRG